MVEMSRVFLSKFIQQGNKKRLQIRPCVLRRLKILSQNGPTRGISL